MCSGSQCGTCARQREVFNNNNNISRVQCIVPVTCQVIERRSSVTPCLFAFVTQYFPPLPQRSLLHLLLVASFVKYCRDRHDFDFSVQQLAPDIVQVLLQLCCFVIVFARGFGSYRGINNNLSQIYVLFFKKHATQ